MTSISTIPTRSLGKSKEQTSCIGFGAMGLAASYGEPADQETVDELLTQCDALQRNGFY